MQRRLVRTERFGKNKARPARIKFYLRRTGLLVSRHISLLLRNWFIHSTERIHRFQQNFLISLFYTLKHTEKLLPTRQQATDCILHLLT